ncbi:hypothetical protein DJ010_16750 [Nocardioides silvaticus]|uniref:DUF2470 domain-containing protein n=1 Tax=Nocardioides silvaticus TaxID=2201891 RepID=A0A316TEX9_9ACTN|nr:hypothetical protein [Nocardioides silvaticus]PWN01689.1 hypothetical protein DJ010_16750 [Nocardioides silvaticus]
MTVANSQQTASRLAAVARSILSCPADVRLVVDGVDDVTAGLLEDPAEGGDVDGEDGLDLRDVDGRPVFACPAGAPLAQAAADGRNALLTLTSGLGRPGSAARAASIVLAGRLAVADREECPCCDRVRDTVCLELDYVLLTRTRPSGERAQDRVPLAEYVSPAHRLNRGFLQRSAEHANRCHQDELRRAVSSTTGTRVRDIGGVHLTDLRPDRVEVQWVDLTGAHSRMLAFGRAATSAAELGELLRDHLHSGIC